MVKRQQVWKDIIHPLATVVGAWGGFPEPPAFFQRLSKNELFQYFLVFLLVYQGGGSEDIATSLMVTIGLYLMTKILNLRTLVGDLEKRGAAIVVPSDEPALVKPAPPAEPLVMPPPTAGPTMGMGPGPTEGFFGGW